MFLTRECDYAIRIVRELADMQVKSVGVICDHEQIPRPFTYKILKKLEKARLVNSFRGASGGYLLSKEPDMITLFDIAIAIDSHLFINECLLPDYKCPRNTDGNPCGVHLELGRLQNILTDALCEKTIAELV